MESILLLVLINLFCLASLKQNYYITPILDGGNCTVIGTALSPCFTLDQLINDDVLTSSNDSSGMHVVSARKTLRVSDKSAVEIQAWNASQEVMVLCQQEADLALRNLVKLKIVSLHFRSCTLEYSFEVIGSEGSVYVGRSVFEGWGQEHFGRSSDRYAIDIYGGINNFTFFNCTFDSNDGAIAVYFHENLISTHLLIMGTMFQGNWRADDNRGGALDIRYTRLTLRNSYVVGNTATKGGAISTEKSHLVLDNTHFAKNHARTSGSSIYLQRQGCTVYIYNYSFLNNSAESGGVITAEWSHPIQTVDLRNSIFAGNIVDDRGGVLKTNYASMTITYCRFINNSANLGGALHIEGREEGYWISNSAFIANEARNDGGAIYCKDNDILIRGSHSLSNLAENGSGGFAYLLNCPMSLQQPESFNSNRASRGGAIFANNSQIRVYGPMMPRGLAT
jgi:predicted outer membrane repeat protein